MSKRIRVGYWVRLKQNVTRTRPRPKARVLSFLSDVGRGVVLDAELDGFRCWNLADLERATRRGSIR